MPKTAPVVWITGASSGIGEALAEQYARQQARLVLSARSGEKLQALAERLPCECLVLPMDVSDFDSFPGKVDAVLAHFGQIDILINNAGVSQRGWAEECGFAVDRRLMDVNFFGPVALTRAVLPHMRARKQGVIAVTSSVMGKVQTPRRTAYAASKHAIQGWFDCLRCEVWKDGIQVTLFLPGYVHTNLSYHALDAGGKPHGKMDRIQANGMPASRCARKMVRAIEKGKEEVIIAGLQERLAAWLKRFTPRLYSAIAKRLPVE